MGEDLRQPRPTDPAEVGWAVFERLAGLESADPGAVDRMTPEQRLVFALGTLRQEVNNGGFDSYFSFGGGDTGILAIAASYLIDPRLGDLVTEACGLFGDPYPAGRDDRFDLVDRLDGSRPGLFDDLDDRFYALEAEIPIDDRTDAFIWSHSDAFFR